MFFIYEYLSFGNLKKYMQEVKFYPSSFNTQTILNIISQLIEGIYILHKFGIIHRDKDNKYNGGNKFTNEEIDNI